MRCEEYKFGGLSLTDCSSWFWNKKGKTLFKITNLEEGYEVYSMTDYSSETFDTIREAEEYCIENE